MDGFYREGREFTGGKAQMAKMAGKFRNSGESMREDGAECELLREGGSFHESAFIDASGSRARISSTVMEAVPRLPTTIPAAWLANSAAD